MLGRRAQFISASALSLVLAIGAAAAAAACSVETTRYSGPSTLGGGGTTSIGADAGVDAAPRTCPSTAPAPDPNCAVKWSTDIFTPLVVGTWTCTTAVCHGAGAPNQPTISSTDAHAARNTLVNYIPTTEVATHRYYIEACSHDATQSVMACNLAGTATCGTQMPIGTPATAADQAKFATWLACGAPDN